MHSEVLTFERQRYEGQGCKKHGGSTSSVPSSRAKHFHRQQRYKAESDSDSDVVLVFDPEGNAEEGATTAQLKLAKQRQEKATFARQGRQPEDDDDVQMVAEVGKVDLIFFKMPRMSWACRVNWRGTVRNPPLTTFGGTNADCQYASPLSAGRRSPPTPLPSGLLVPPFHHGRGTGEPAALPAGAQPVANHHCPST